MATVEWIRTAPQVIMTNVDPTNPDIETRRHYFENDRPHRTCNVQIFHQTTPGNTGSYWFLELGANLGRPPGENPATPLNELVYGQCPIGREGEFYWDVVRRPMRIPFASEPGGMLSPILSFNILPYQFVRLQLDSDGNEHNIATVIMTLSS